MGWSVLDVCFTPDAQNVLYSSWSDYSKAIGPQRTSPMCSMEMFACPVHLTVCLFVCFGKRIKNIKAIQLGHFPNIDPGSSGGRIE